MEQAKTFPARTYKLPYKNAVDLEWIGVNGTLEGVIDIEWVTVGDGPPAAMIIVHDDSWAFMADLADLWRAIAPLQNTQLSREAFIEILEKCNFINRTSH